MPPMNLMRHNDILCRTVVDRSVFFLKGVTHTKNFIFGEELKLKKLKNFFPALQILQSS